MQTKQLQEQECILKRSTAADRRSLIHTGLLLSEAFLHQRTLGNLHRNFANYRRSRIKITNDTNYYKQLNVHRCNISPVRTGLQSIFLLLSRDCLKKGQNQEHDGSHLELYLFEWLKLKSKAKVRRGSEHSTRVLNLEASQHDVMISLHC